MSPSPAPDVVIVGAGAAGLAAAVRLHGAGLDVAVVEARERIGGRIHTIRDPRTAVPVELGAEFVHGEAPVTHRILDAVGVEPIPMEGPAWRAGHGRVDPGGAVWEGIGRVLRTLDPGRDPDRSFADFLRDAGDRFEPADVRAARAFVEGFWAADPERIGERALAAGGEGGAGESTRVPGGYGVLVGELARRLPEGTVSLGLTVKQVAWRPGRVEVSCVPSGSRGEATTITAGAIIVTVPLGVLAAPDSEAGVSFDPPIPELPEALEGVAMGSAVRVTLSFRRPLWGADPLLPTPPDSEGPPSFLHAPGGAFGTYWTAEPGASTLVAWSGGPRSLGLDGPAGALAARALDELARAAGADPTRLHDARTGAWCHDWQQDPYSLGAYAYITVGGETAPQRLARPIRDTVFIAGEATVAHAIGTVESALESGERAADMIIQGV